MIAINIEISKQIDSIISEMEEQYKIELEYANWYNNEVPGTRQTDIDSCQPKIPIGLNKLKELQLYIKESYLMQVETKL